MPTSNAVFLNPHVRTEPTASSASKDVGPGSDLDAASNPDLIQKFHHALPNFNVTPLLNVPSLAEAFGIGNVLVKAESSRLGLPAFKILGASWGVYRALCQHFGLDPASSPPISLDGLGQRAQDAGVVLFAATDGNHGRAVARMAKLLGVTAKIFAPKGMYSWTQEYIRGEGAEVVVVQGDYDRAVEECWDASQIVGDGHKGRVGIMVQDNAFEGYDVVPQWIVDGYRTLLTEVDEQVAVNLKQNAKIITHVVTPIGVGSLGRAVVRWAKTLSDTRAHPIKVIAVEPATAACLFVSLTKGESVTIETEDTIMSGMCCGTVSPTSWQGLKDGVDVSVTVEDLECHRMVEHMEKLKLEEQEFSDVEVGPCGAGCLVGLSKVCGNENIRSALGFNEGSVVVVLSTEGRREYPIPSQS